MLTIAITLQNQMDSRKPELPETISETLHPENLQKWLNKAVFVKFEPFSYPRLMTPWNIINDYQFTELDFQTPNLPLKTYL